MESSWVSPASQRTAPLHVARHATMSGLCGRARAGKTLQGITLLWTLLQSGHALRGGAPLARRVIICCPTSLVNNWDSECVKWLKARKSVPHAGRLRLHQALLRQRRKLQYSPTTVINQTQSALRIQPNDEALHGGQGRVRTLPLCESSRDDVIQSIAQFLSPRNPFQARVPHASLWDTHMPASGGHACPPQSQGKPRVFRGTALVAQAAHHTKAQHKQAKATHKLLAGLWSTVS